MTLTCNGKKVTVMEWFREYWRTQAAILYMLICLVDFIIMPGFIVHLEYTRETNYKKVLVLKDYPEIMKLAIENMEVESGAWMPFTLRGAGLFHISFGMILTGTIVGRMKRQNGTGDGQSRKNKV